MVDLIKKNVLRFLKYKGQEMDDDLNNLIDSCIEDGKKYISFKGTSKRFKIKFLDEGILIEGSDILLRGNNIKRILKNCDEVYLMAITLGMEMDRKIAYYERFDLTRSIILDSVGAAFADYYTDLYELELRKELKSNEKFSFRFSPGYGDMPLDTQKDFNRLISMDRNIGVNVSENFLLMPRKSVTAILGVLSMEDEIILPDDYVEEEEEEYLNRNKCSTCGNGKKCDYRNGESSDGC